MLLLGTLQGVTSLMATIPSIGLDLSIFEIKIMKKIQKPKSRYAKILFNRECPYSQKVVKSKKKYTRKQKYLTHDYEMC